MNILILCTGNSCRSQMADGFLSEYLKGQASVYSAGVEVHGLNPRAVQVLKEAGIDISSNTSNHMDEYAQIAFDYVITVCDHAQEVCPNFPQATKKLHHNFPDPAKATGTEEEILQEFRSTRDLIQTYCRKFADQILAGSPIH